MNRENLSPKLVAQALGVSESSVKRWCDGGLIPYRHTAGGHRRIPISGLIQFLRTSKRPLAQPELLQLPQGTSTSPGSRSKAAQQLTEALLVGNEMQCRKTVIELYLASHPLSAIGDEVLATAFTTIGQLWQCGDAEIFQERRACEIALRVLHELEGVLPPPPAGAPLALGGAIAADPSSLPTTLVGLVLRECGWNATSLGCDLPLSTMAAAITQHRPALFWISCSYLSDPPSFLAEYQSLYNEFHTGVAFVVGGRALNQQVRQQMKFAAYGDNMQHLAAFAESLRPA